MSSRLPSRPNLEHLRRQAKALLADLAAGDPDAVATLREHLPAAKKMTAAAVAKAAFRLADAQSAVARKSGFAAWPHLARHVELLRALEGTWTFDRLTVDGADVPSEVTGASRLLIDGDRFRTEAPDATYEGVFTIDVEADPAAIDIDFVEGPEAGRRNLGVFRLDGDRLELCLDLGGGPRPKAFAARAGSGHAHEVLRRAVRARPESVTGGKAPAPRPTPTAAPAAALSPMLRRLQGAWSAVQLVRDGTVLPAAMLQSASRTAKGDEVEIVVAGKVMVHARVRLDESADPVGVEYHNVGGPAKGTVQHGVLRWDGDEACFCIAPPGAPRPDGFDAPKGSGRSLSRWRRRT